MAGAPTQALHKPYQHGFVTNIASDALPPGLNKGTIRAISRGKHEPDFLLRWRLTAFERWRTMEPPDWGHLHMEPIDFQALCYYSAPKPLKDDPKSLAEVDPKLLEKLNEPQHERALILAEEGSHARCLESCTAPQRDEHQLHAAVVEHKATTASRRSASSTASSAGIAPQEATTLIVGGFCQTVHEELPMEFALEAKTLLAVSLECAVG